MLSEEEKKAIRNLENLSEYGLSTTLNQADLDKMKTVLNIITKLQKENEEKDIQIKTLKHTNKTYKGMLNKQSKQIDLMAFSLADYVMYYEYDKCRNPEMIKQKAKELKQYFETKAKKGE